MEGEAGHQSPPCRVRRRDAGNMVTLAGPSQDGGPSASAANTVESVTAVPLGRR